MTDARSPQLDTEACWELLQRVVNSQELRRATRLRELLLYLGERALRGHAASIREQEIGAAVFGRSDSYDTNIDNIVRVNVSELRKRLAHYFEAEGADEPWLMEIPRGGYLPVFELRPVAPVVTQTAVAEPYAGRQDVPVPVLEAEEARGSVGDRTNKMRGWIAFGVGCTWAVALGVIVVLLGRVHALQNDLQPWQADRTSMAFWQQFFGAGEPVDIVTADTSYALAEDLLKRPISLNDYLDYQYKNFANFPDVTPQTRDALNLVLDRNTGSVGDFEAAQSVLRLDPHSPLVRLASSRLYTPQNVKTHNVILIGSRQSNPWVELYKDRMNFYIEYDPAVHRSYVVDRQPAKGERAVYEIGDDPNRDYSVVAFIPNLTQKHYTLILAGTDSQGTKAAGEFITSREGLEAVRERLPADKNPYFEVLLSSTRLEGTTLRTSIVAARGYSK